MTVCGGHRVGVAGQVVLEHGRVRNVKHISFINIRVSHQIKGCATCLLPYVIKDGRLLHTLIISPPGCGKTTILRDLVRLISDGNSYCRGMNVGVVDERSELAACYMGIPQNDVGLRTDILDGCPKAEGMLMLLRTRPVLRKLVEEKVFERYIVLGRSAGIGTVESIFDERGNELYIGSLSVAN